MPGKAVFITGATSGIGRETARQLANKGFRIIMACRNSDKAAQVIKEIKEQTRNQNVHSVRLDLARLEAVRECVRVTMNEYGLPDILINNAGIFNNTRRETVDGLEETMAVNYYSPFLLTMLFVPDFVAADKPVRIINISSKAALHSNLHIDQLSFNRRYHSFRAYGASKLALLYFTRELAKRLLATRITVNSVHPGSVNTNIWNMQPNLIAKIMKKFSLTPEEGAKTTVYLASSSETDKVTGKFFYRKNIVPYNSKSSKPSLQYDLWQHSLKVVGLRDVEKDNSKWSHQV